VKYLLKERTVLFIRYLMCMMRKFQSYLMTLFQLHFLKTWSKQYTYRKEIKHLI